VVPISPLPGISLSGFASRHAAEWFHISRGSTNVRVTRQHLRLEMLEYPLVIVVFEGVSELWICYSMEAQEKHRITPRMARIEDI
jgi:hypothetical protein